MIFWLNPSNRKESAMTMVTFPLREVSLEGVSQLFSGIQEWKFVPVFSPTVVLWDREEVRKERVGVKAFERSKHEIPRKGIYILIQTTPNEDGRYNVSVGLSGFQEQTLFDRIKYHMSNPDPEIKGWDQAALICDWEDDIRRGAKAVGNPKKVTQDKKIVEVMKMEVFYLEKMMNEVLKEFEKNGLLSLKRNDSPSFNAYMPNPDIERYECYCEIALQLLESVVPDFKNMDENRLSKGDILYGKFDSEAVIVDANQKIQRVDVKKFTIKGRPAKQVKKNELKNVSLNVAANFILKENGQKPVSANEFWHVIRNNEKVKKSSL